MVKRIFGSTEFVRNNGVSANVPGAAIVAALLNSPVVNAAAIENVFSDLFLVFVIMLIAME